MSLLLLAAAAGLASTPELGTREGQCRPSEPGPALLIDVLGLKDRQGRLRAELYPPVESDFLADDNVLIAAGKTFARVDVEVPRTGPTQLCIRLPRAGRYALMVLHDRKNNRKFDLFQDGIGFPGNPVLGWGRPSVAHATLVAGTGLTRLEIRLNYFRGLAMRPLEDR